MDRHRPRPRKPKSALMSTFERDRPQAIRPVLRFPRVENVAKTEASMNVRIFILATILSAAGNATGGVPDGFMPLFNGKDLTNWRGRGHVDPRETAALSPEAKQEKQADDNENMRKHWRVERGVIVNDGQGVFLTTAKDYADFELLLDWKMVSPRSDSGIYLRGCPQIQIWDPDNPQEINNGAARGSGAMWNNNPDSNGRFPLVRADRPIGQWNQLRIRMVGDRVTVHLNDKLVVDNAVMHNYFDRKRPMFERGPIQIQTHGGEMRFRNLYLREITGDN